MKRALFLGAAAAAGLTGCGGGRVMRALPGVASGSPRVAAPTSFTYTPADPIPASVLANPIIGEWRRFDGAAAPAGWTLVQGQNLDVAANRILFSILGTSGGGNGKTSFILPRPRAGWIVAVSGAFVSSPAALTTLGRHMTHQDSLGAGAVPVAAFSRRKPDTARQQAMREVQQLRGSSIVVGSARPSSDTPELRARIERSNADARTNLLAVLDAANRARVLAQVDAVTNGTTSLNAAIAAMRASLSPGEASALLDAHDQQARAFRSAWTGIAHTDPQLEAARFVVDGAFTPAQRDALDARLQNG